MSPPNESPESDPSNKGRRLTARLDPMGAIAVTTYFPRPHGGNLADIASAPHTLTTNTLHKNRESFTVRATNRREINQRNRHPAADLLDSKLSQIQIYQATA